MTSPMAKDEAKRIIRECAMLLGASYAVAGVKISWESVVLEVGALFSGKPVCRTDGSIEVIGSVPGEMHVVAEGACRCLKRAEAIRKEGKQ